ncbi:5-methylcytosine restriction system specificity protein McrC [Clostridium perfringens]|uniref:5-methylcytosine restriction system specificity protein McrC n=1 Tax=Clostridium TaxID=1485 RepID=UPI002A2333B3|nr:hypothetical protein [Clostridium perfringens]MDK0701108.1 hypothetical protein [Clostridium perfringens]MDM0542957.1 hypothetical protein [Clostridium perfringens]MDM0882807.1 hypothetical protein [Clostridium perfringens]MDM0941268.1 hypothetical protein [Clostridium perfringens]
MILNRLSISENESVKLDNKYIDIANEILIKNSSLPFKIYSNTIVFDEYTIGHLQLNDLIIEISPRHTAFSLEKIFEMYLYIHTSNNNIKTLNYSFDSSYGLSSISTLFCSLCKKLLQYGLTGEYIKEREYSFSIKGNILPELYNRKLIPINGVANEFNNYTLNVPANQLIKSALLKLLNIESITTIRNDLNSILRDFEMIDTYNQDIALSNIYASNFFSSNTFYPLVLEYATKILQDMKVGLKNGDIEWSIFLENSNSLFEKYIRKIIKSNLIYPVDKWLEPKPYASISYNNYLGYKSFSPDIIIDYNKSNNTCKAILDVKNKENLINKQNLSNLVSASDMYQIIFYCNQLNCTLGGLIYPSSIDIDPIPIIIDNKNNLHICLIYVNMNSSIKKRHSKLINDINKHLLIFS